MDKTEIETIRAKIQRERNKLWHPIFGQETQNLVERLKPNFPANEDLDIVVEEGTRILSRCSPPTISKANDTGLVIGYIQSGKTLSFTMLSTLAHDNGYKLIIIITGINTNLFQQSSNRLRNDLDLDRRRDRKWRLYKNPRSSNAHDFQSISDTLASGDVPEGLPQQTVLITVMKNVTHLTNLGNLLDSLDLRNVPTLIIDDEADQASLNTKVKKDEESATYSSINIIRGRVPNHTFLQYTATPQALLLINLIDTLSPRFVEILTPGVTYTGGKTFFNDGIELVKPIRRNEIFDEPTKALEPPRSLIDALRIFFVGVALGFFIEKGVGNRSMMIHPSHKTVWHSIYAHWVRSIKQNWTTILELGEDSQDYQDLLDIFEITYQDLSTTIDELPDFKSLVDEKYLLYALRNTTVIEVNASRGKTPTIDWANNYPVICVGGEVLNRGYTIEGLTVSYMPRGIGIGNADTIQQRARWFGYKAGYLGYCRVYLDALNVEAYKAYIEHEEDVRKQLAEYSESGKSLKNWKRTFLLTPSLQPTRSNVLAQPYYRFDFSDDWFAVDFPLMTKETISANRELTSRIISELYWAEDKGSDGRTKEQTHSITEDIPLSYLYESFLIDLQFEGIIDSKKYLALLMQLNRFIQENPDAKCSVYLMSKGSIRERSVAKSGKIRQLFQGANYRGDEKTYPGDRSIFSSNNATFQIHTVNIKNPPSDSNLEYRALPILAARLTPEMSSSWLTQ